METNNFLIIIIVMLTTMRIKWQPCGHHPHRRPASPWRSPSHKGRCPRCCRCPWQTAVLFFYPAFSSLAKSGSDQTQPALWALVEGDRSRSPFYHQLRQFPLNIHKEGNNFHQLSLSLLQDECTIIGRKKVKWKWPKWKLRSKSRYNFVFLKKPNARIYKCVDSGSKSRIYKSVDSAGLISFAQNQQYVLRWSNQGGWRGINATTNNNNRLFQCWSLFDHKNMVLRLLQM